jgi:hypothetical protein
MRSATTAAPIFPNAFADSRAQIQNNSNLSIVGSWIRNLRPTLINDLRYTHGNRYNLQRAAGTGSGKNGELHIKGVDPARFPRVTVAGHTPPLGSTATRAIQTDHDGQIIDMTW